MTHPPPDGTLRKPTANPLPSDVLCGRGGGTNHHIGNSYWRSLVSANKRLYLTLPKRQKALLAKSIVYAIRSHNPSGAFLQKGEDGLWYDIGDKRACDKTSQALREGAPEIRHEMREENSNVAGLGGPGLTTRPGQILPNGMIALDYSGVQPIDAHTEAGYNGKDGLVSRGKKTKNANNTKSAAAPAAVPYGYAAPMPFSESSMLQAFQQFQTGGFQMYQAQVPNSNRESITSNTSQARLEGSDPQGAVMLQQKPAQQQHQHRCPPASVATSIHPAFLQGPANGCEMPQAQVPSTNIPPIYIPNSNKAPGRIDAHNPYQVSAQTGASAASTPKAGIGLPEGQTDISFEIPQEVNGTEGAAMKQQPTIPTQVHGDHNINKQSHLQNQTYHQAHLHQPGAQKGPCVTEENASVAAATTTARIPGISETPQVQEPAVGLVGIPQQSQLYCSWNDLAVELALRENMLIARQNAVLSTEARLEDIRRMQQLQNQAVFQRQHLFNGGGANLDRLAFLNRLGLQGNDRLDQHANIQRQALDDAILRQRLLGRVDPSVIDSPVIGAKGFSGLSHEMLDAHSLGVARENLMATLQHQVQQTDEVAELDALAEDNKVPPQNVLEHQDTYHSLSSLRSNLLPSATGRWGSSLSHDQLLGLRRSEHALTTLRGLSSLSQEELLRLRSACLAREDEITHINELWNRQRRELAEVANEELNAARQGTPVEVRQNSLDFLARAAEIADTRNTGHSSSTSSLSDENMMVRQSHYSNKDAKKKRSIWESMKKASSKINPKPGKATQSIINSDSELSPPPSKKRKTRFEKSEDVVANSNQSTNKSINQAHQSVKDTELKLGKSNKNLTESAKAKFDLRTPREDDNSKQNAVEVIGATNLTATRSQSSDTPSTLSTSLALFKEQKNALIEAAVLPNRSHADLLPAPLKTKPIEQSPIVDLSLPLPEVSFKVNYRLEEGQFDDPDEE